MNAWSLQGLNQHLLKLEQNLEKTVENHLQKVQESHFTQKQLYKVSRTHPPQGEQDDSSSQSIQTLHKRKKLSQNQKKK